MVHVIYPCVERVFVVRDGKNNSRVDTNQFNING